jgi:serine protease
VTAFRIDDVSLATTAAPLPPPSADLLVSGGFEPAVAGWTASGAAKFATGTAARSGSGFATLAGMHSATGTVSQTIVIPAGANPLLGFWININSQETSTTIASDKVIVDLLDAGGSLLKRLGTFSNLHKVAGGTYSYKGEYGLGAYAGRTVRLRFRATTDAANLTTFRIDDVSMK